MNLLKRLMMSMSKRLISQISQRSRLQCREGMSLLVSGIEGIYFPL